MARLMAMNLGVKVSSESPHDSELCLNLEWNTKELFDVEYDYEIRIVEKAESIAEM